MFPDTKSQCGLVRSVSFSDFSTTEGEVVDVLLRLRVEDAGAIVLLHVPVVVEEDKVEHLLNNVVEEIEVRNE